MYSDKNTLEKLSKEELIAIVQSDTQKTHSFKNLLENINGISWEFDLKQDKFTCVSPTTEKILGYKMEEWTDFDSWKNMLHEDDQESVSCYCAEQTQDGKDHLMEYKMVKKSGEILWVLDIVTLGKDADGNADKLYGFILDITQTKEAQLKLEKEHQFLQTVLDSTPNPIMIINADYSVTLMNEARKKDIKGRTFLDNNSPKCYEISHFRDTPCDGADHGCPLQNVLETGEASKVIHNHKTADGKDQFFELNATPLFDENHNCTGIIETAVNITPHISLRNELQKSNEELMHTAHHDYLTGLPNRALFMDRFEQTIKDAKRSNTASALFFMDLDHFKEVNDEHGHDAGDIVLKEVSRRFLTSVRENDTVSRLAGDEFTIIVKDFKSKDDIVTLATKIVALLNEPIKIKDNMVQISTSIGISIFPHDANNAQDLLLLADDAMYKAKAKGKNTFSFYD
jgi:diguanylate cyclase (GGDEF)-like protein/PAS domain S-box-containing protein